MGFKLNFIECGLVGTQNAGNFKHYATSRVDIFVGADLKLKRSVMHFVFDAIVIINENSIQMKLKPGWIFFQLELSNGDSVLVPYNEYKKLLKEIITQNNNFAYLALLKFGMFWSDYYILVSRYYFRSLYGNVSREKVKDTYKY